MLEGREIYQLFCYLTKLWSKRNYWKSSHRIHRMVEVVWDLEVIRSNLTVQAGSPRAGCPGPCPGGIWISPRMESLQPLRATCQCPAACTTESVSWCSEGTSCVSVCAHWLWSCHWALLRRACLHPLCTLLSGIYAYWDPPWACSSPRWTAPALSASPNRRDALNSDC